MEQLLNNEERISWNDYFKEVASLASRRSNCKRLKVGSVIVNNDNRLVSMGYNGFIAGAPHESIMRDGHEQATIHSEMNAIIYCKECIKGYSIYITHYPCLNCFKLIATAGIKKIYYLNDYNNDPLVEELNKGVGIEIIKLD